MEEISKKLINIDSSSSTSNISSCLENLERNIKSKNNLAKMVEDWPKLVGEQLAENCCPLKLTKFTLFIGAEQPQWRQALLYNQLKLLSSIKAAGYKVKELKIQQYYPSKISKIDNEKNIWDNHPSRIDVHGMEKCSECGSPSPTGELARWGKCSFCKRESFGMSK